ncbi:uncharacterized protein BDV14DRAFT_203009 [Aspergillus stella-maris]|uniref:uncharacterized protein n=1 Tax=Aspergillus stella-maris TaxID=1810926 RepID=UPI003CCE27FF
MSALSTSVSQLLHKAADTSLELSVSLLSTQQPVRRKESSTLPSPLDACFSSSSSTTSARKPASPPAIPKRKPIEDWVDLENSRNDACFRLLNGNEEHRAVYEASSRIPLPIPSPDGKKGRGRIVSSRLEAKKADGSGSSHFETETQNGEFSHGLILALNPSTQPRAPLVLTSKTPPLGSSTLSREDTEKARERRNNEIIADRILRVGFDELEYTIAVMRLRQYEEMRASEQEGEEQSSSQD